MDGPNQGHGSCQGDSGGPLYHRSLSPVSSEIDDGELIEQLPVLLGSVVMGPECDEGIGYNTDLRQYIDWIQELCLLRWVEDGEITRGFCKKMSLTFVCGMVDRPSQL